MAELPPAESGEEELNLGHHGAGDDCITKVITYGGSSVLIGKSFNINILFVVRSI